MKLIDEIVVCSDASEQRIQEQERDLYNLIERFCTGFKNCALWTDGCNKKSTHMIFAHKFYGDYNGGERVANKDIPAYIKMWCGEIVDWMKNLNNFEYRSGKYAGRLLITIEDNTMTGGVQITFMNKDENHLDHELVMMPERKDLY